MKTLIVGDIHGKVPVVERALAQESPVIFIGDYLDSYDRPVSDHIKCLELIEAAIDSGKAQALLGNHELSYLMARMRCSGWNSKTEMHIHGGWGHKLREKFLAFLFYEPNILITHGGLDNLIWTQYNLSLETMPETLAEWANDPNSPAYWIGQSRGGPKPCGGIFWCDFEREFTPVPGLIQIVGHTRGQTLRKNGKNFCIDYHDYLNDLFYYDLPTEE